MLAVETVVGIFGFIPEYGHEAPILQKVIIGDCQVDPLDGQFILHPESKGLQRCIEPFVNRYEGIDVVGDALRYKPRMGGQFSRVFIGKQGLEPVILDLREELLRVIKAVFLPHAAERAPRVVAVDCVLT